MDLNITISAEERNIIQHSLDIRKHIIETGCPTLGATDIQNMGAKEAKHVFGAEIKALTIDQMKFLVVLDDIKKKLRV